MKVALTVFKWVGMGFSITAMLESIAFIISPLFLFGIYGTIVNAKAISKHLKEQQTVKMGVLQCISIRGVIPGVMMFLANDFRNKLETAETAEVEETVEVNE